MAQFRLSMTVANRGAGRKVVAMAAYRSGEKLDDRSHGETQDYSHRAGVVHSEIVLPENAPEWASDRAALWSEVENREKADNVTLAREVQLSLPHELTDAQRIELTQEFAQHIAAEYGLAVDMNIHTPSREGSQLNHHAHLMLTTRAFDDDRADGWSKTKDRRFNPKEMQQQGKENAVSELREVWEGMQNRALERADIRDADGQLIQVDRRSYEARGLEVEPTIKLGPAATDKQRNGEDSDRAQINDEIRERNAANQNDRQQSDDRQPPTDERAQIEREAAAVKLEMAELFETMAGRPGLAMQFERRQRELAALQVEVKELLKEGRRESDRMNEMLLGGPVDLDRQRSSQLDLDREPQRRSRFYGLDAMNRELSDEREAERKKDRGGKGKQQDLLNTYPRQEREIERTPPPPEPERQGYGRSR